MINKNFVFLNMIFDRINIYNLDLKGKNRILFLFDVWINLKVNAQSVFLLYSLKVDINKVSVSFSSKLVFQPISLGSPLSSYDSRHYFNLQITSVFFINSPDDK